jgi:deoxyribonuclease V
MYIPSINYWPTTAEEAVAMQQELRNQVITTSDRLGSVKLVAGVDVGFENGGEVTRAAVAILRFPELTLVDQAIAKIPTSFPYIPGLLSFREIPALLLALEKITVAPDLILCDGQGIAHPRRLGIASHLGLLIDIPTIGVGKSLLVGRYEMPSEERGSWSPLIHYKETIGAVLRTRKGFNPLFISPGHLVSLETSIEYVMKCTTKYRLPETTRMAHHMASNMKDG